MLSKIREKVRALCEDFSTSDFEVFVYTTSPIFTVSECNVTSILKVLINGIETSDYTYDSATNKITITSSGVSSGDNIEVDFNLSKYSNNELDEYIRAGITWMSIYSYDSIDYEIDNNSIYPTPDNKTVDFIAIITSVLINPNWSQYKLPNMTVSYPRNMSKEEKIQKLVKEFNSGLGVTNILEFDN